MPTLSNILKRGDARLQSLYDSVEQGKPVDWKRLALLEDIETVQLGRIFTQEAIDRNRAADEKLSAVSDQLSAVSDQLSAKRQPVES